MRTCQRLSHYVYVLRSRPLVRDLAARVRGQIASDHCRSDLITGRTHWARAGYPFPEVNLPEKSPGRQLHFMVSSTSSLRAVFTDEVVKGAKCWSIGPAFVEQCFEIKR